MPRTSSARGAVSPLPSGGELVGAIIVLVGFLEQSAQDISASLAKRGAVSVVVSNATRAKVVATLLAVDVVLVGPAMALGEGFDLARSVSESASSARPAVLGVARDDAEIGEVAAAGVGLTRRDLQAIHASLVDAVALRRSC